MITFPLTLHRLSGCDKAVKGVAMPWTGACPFTVRSMLCHQIIVHTVPLDILS